MKAKNKSIPDPEDYYVFDDCLGYDDRPRINEVLSYCARRLRAGKPIDPAVRIFVARGLERIVSGKIGFPAKKGRKKRSKGEALARATRTWGLFCTYLAREDRDEAITHTAEDMEVSDDTVERDLNAFLTYLKTERPDIAKALAPAILPAATRPRARRNS